MADIRIKDLTTTASSTASGDFFVIDGTTGTRKVNAFNPSFGGNATVTGTLTSNGAITGPTLAPGVNTAAHYFTAYGATTSWPLRISTIYDSNYVDQYLTLNGTLTGSRATPTFTGAAVGGSFIRSNGENSVLSVGTFVSGAGAAINTVAVFNPTNVTIPQTTASTTTSSGALVVGNGTSGGLGVGGSVNIHNNLTLGYASAGDSILKLWRSQGGSEWLQITGWSGGSLGNNAYSIDAVNGASARPVYFRRSTDAGSTYTNFLTWDTSNNATFGGTITSTTSTDSGVLQLNLVNSSTGTSASSLFRFNAGTRTATLQAYNDTHATLAGQLRVGTSNGDIVVIPSGVAAATFGASAISLGALNYTNTITGGDSGAGTSIAQFRDGLGSTKINFKGNGEVTLSATTASTSTSSGALVVSGGVGVAKRIHSGEGLTTNGDNETQITFTRNGTISIGPTSAATPKLAVGGGLQLSNTSQSIPAWGDVGAQLSVAGAVLTDTSSSGTVGRIVTNSIAASALAASSTTTYTAAASLFIAGAPTANTNVTITNAYALYTAGGRINFQGLPTSSAGLQAGTLWNDGGTLKVA